MSEQDNINVVKASFGALTAHDLNKWSALQTTDSTTESTGGLAPMNLEQNQMFLQNFLTAFPDLHFVVTRIVAQGNDVVAHWTVTGKHNGPLLTPIGNTIPATGKKAVVTGSNTFELKSGKIYRAWSYWDMTSLLSQLGLMPPM